MIALSSAYKEALVAVEIDGEKAFRSLDANCKHSENLLLTLDDALASCNKTLKDNDVFAVVIGPGSFTGVRIAAALVKGLVAGDERKNILPITTFELMAYSYINQFGVKEDFACIINALSGNYFVCMFDKNGNPTSLPEMVDKDGLEAISCPKIGLKEENLGDNQVVPTAEDLLALAKIKMGTTSLISGVELVPIYLRKSQAEVTLEEKEKNQKNSKN